MSGSGKIYFVSFLNFLTILLGFHVTKLIFTWKQNRFYFLLNFQTTYWAFTVKLRDTFTFQVKALKYNFPDRSSWRLEARLVSQPYQNCWQLYWFINSWIQCHNDKSWSISQWVKTCHLGDSSTRLRLPSLNELSANFYLDGYCRMYFIF